MLKSAIGKIRKGSLSDKKPAWSKPPKPLHTPIFRMVLNSEKRMKNLPKKLPLSIESPAIQARESRSFQKIITKLSKLVIK